MIYTLTLNPSIDYIVDTVDMSLGNTNRACAEKMYAGGKGINVSIELKHLGIESVAYGFIAGFVGEEIVRLLQNTNIDTELIKLKNGCSRINVKIRSKEETELNGIGPIIDDESMKVLFEKLNGLKKEDILVLSGSIPSRLSSDLYEDIIKHIDKSEAKVIVDATGKALVNTLLHHPFLIKPNKAELQEIFGKTIDKKEDIIMYAQKLKEMGAVNVLVSLGRDGAILVDEFGNVHCKSAPVGEVINSVGAGDSMVAGFIWGYINGDTYEECLTKAICVGSASAFSEEFATIEKVDRLMKTM